MKESWSPKELKKLLHGLRMHGEKEVEQIAAEIQTKSVDMVQEYIGFLKERKHRTVKQRNSRVDKTPLEDWLRIIRQHMGGDCDYSHVITNVVEIISRFEPCDRFAWGKGTKPNYRRIYAFLARVLRGDTAAPTADLNAAEAAIVLDQIERIKTKLSALHELGATAGQVEFLRKFNTPVPRRRGAASVTPEEPASVRDETFSLNPLAIPIPLLELGRDVNARENADVAAE